VQQPQRTEPTGLDPYRPADLRQQPLSIRMPLDGKEKSTEQAEAPAARTKGPKRPGASVGCHL